MKIISKFHDYYDSCLSLGHDDNVVYKREHLTFDSRKKDTSEPAIVEALREYFYSVSSAPSTSNKWRYASVFASYLPSVTSSKEYDVYWNCILIIFCGKMYRGIKFKVTNRGVSTTACFYDADDAADFLRKHGVEVDTAEKQRDTILQKLRHVLSEVQQINNEWLIANKITCAVFDSDGLHINPKLQDYQFYRKMDAYTAFQELDMWISGTLAYPHNVMLEIDDKYRVIAHGFDEKYGFRTRPGSKK